MEFKEALGIDVSKKTIDVKLHLAGVHHKFENKVKGYKSLLAWVKKQTGLNLVQVMICFEHTGLYSLPLAVFLSEQKIIFCMESALQIKRSLGLTRGKNDRIDAKRIAEYAYLRREQLKHFVQPSMNVLKLQKLISLRGRLVKQRAGFIGSMKEFKAMLKQKEHKLMFSVQKKIIHFLSKQIDILEKEMIDLIKADEVMEELYDLVVSVKGVGLILASNLLVVTNCFSGFEDSRKFSCYAGIAPFGKQSGTSLKTRSRVSHYANKKIKVLLNLSAGSAIQADPELKAYYQKRIANGKSRMSTLNIVRNKIVHRIFAVVTRRTPYVPLYQHAA